MKFIDRQIKFLNDAITSKLIKEERNIKTLEREMAQTNDVQMKRSLERSIKYQKINIEELQKLREMFND